MKVYVALFMLTVFVHAEDPKAPSWPSRFSQTFEESFSYPVVGQGQTKGTFFYDWEARRYRVDRDNGKWDRYCGTIFKLTNTPCSHIVVDGRRYLYFPEKNYCCMCCTTKGGCDVLKPNWMDGSIYEGEVTELDSNKKMRVFNQKGLQDNKVYYDVESGVMARIVQGTNDDQKFNVSSFNSNFDAGLLDLPGACDPNKKCGYLTICSALNAVKANIV